jgi:hypothetical protein
LTMRDGQIAEDVRHEQRRAARDLQW